MKFLGNYINGEFVTERKGAAIHNINPYNLAQPHFEWFENPARVDEAIEGAKKAFYLWRETSREHKLQLFKKLEKSFQNKKDLFTQAIVQETGKALWEAKIEAGALGTKLKITTQDVLQLIQQLESTGRIEGKSEFKLKPRGVCGVIGPFNFPLHLSNGHILPALLMGNTIVYKPSEQAPQCASLYVECFHEAGFPKGVIQLVHGAKASGIKIIENKDIDAIFFTGSYPVGYQITKDLLQQRKDLSTLAALEMGGKNAAVIHPSADLKNALSEVITSAFATTGQRCSSTSRLFVHQSIYQEVRKHLIKAISKIPYGDPNKESTFFGPLIHPDAVDTYFKKLELAKKEGFQSTIDSKRENDCVVTPSLYESHDPKVHLQSTAFQEEFFGPNLLMMSYEDKESLVEQHEATPYGLVASIFSEDKDFYDYCDQNFQVGLLNWNRGTVGANSMLPFGGLKRSGNNWPAGLFSFLYCSHPRSYLYEENKFESSRVPAPLQKVMEDL